MLGIQSKIPVYNGSHGNMKPDQFSPGTPGGTSRALSLIMHMSHT